MHIFKHFITITKHRRIVRKLCFKCHLYRQGLTHDLSKYSFTEFFVGAKYYSGTFSPNANERKDKGYSEAWMHHKGRNKHHCEYWIDVDPNTKQYRPVEIPLNYLIESFCDRIAACIVYNKDKFQKSDAYIYLEKEKNTLPIHEKSYELLDYYLRFYATHTNKECFNLIKSDLKKFKKNKKN